MNDKHDDRDIADDLEIVDPQNLFDELVLDDPEHERQYLRTQWIEDVLLQLIEERVRLGLTQRDLGERMGKPQSSIARLERGDDLKLSVLWDYLAATGQAPQGRIPLVPLKDQRDQLSKYVVGTTESGVSPVLRVQHWRNVPLSTDERGVASGLADHAPVPSTPDDDVTRDDTDNVAVA